jgi:Tol biopolymer transport system component
MVVLGVDELNLRQGPGLDRPILAQMPLGTVVEVLRAPEWDGARFWYNVRVPQSGQEGWASEFYLASFELARSPVLFTSSQAGSEDIYQVYPDGTGLRQLTSAPGHEFDPSWSPDASHIVFGYRQDGNTDLYSMEADGASWQQLTYTEADEVHPAWSPDGQRIAYVSDADGDWEIFVLNRDTGQVQQLTSNDAWDSFPSWSPDGTRLVFTSRQTGNYDLFVVDVNTLQVLQLTTSPYSDAQASWSPQGDEIVYTMVVAEGGALQRELGVLSLQDPGHPRRATFSDPGEALHRYPDWSPDGRFVVFVSGDGEAARLYVKPAGGTYMVGITEASLAVSSAPSWAR